MNLFTAYVYQPFLNVLVLAYWAVGRTPLGYDMGIAVILLTLFIRFLLLPMTLAGHRSEKERRDVDTQVKAIRERYPHDPVQLQKAIRGVLRSKPRILVAEGFMFSIQVIISLILLRIFSRGLGGEDLHLIYQWMPDVPQPFNLVFLDRFDLTHPHMVLNLLQSLVIFLLEAVALVTSPYPTNRSEVVRVQLTLPIVSFLVFAFLPAGKKLFVITTLIFSLLVIIVRHVIYLYHRYFPEPPPEEPKSEQYLVVPESMVTQMKANAQTPQA
jgi:membrane protein insertase Oxa1/YidC/SpoIIIJ